MKTTTNFVLDGQRVEIVFTTERGSVSLTGSYDGSGGQIDELLREAYDEHSEYISALETVLIMWEEWHLKPLDVANPEQVSDLECLVSAMHELDGKRFPAPIEGGKAEDYEEWDENEFSDVINSRDVIARIEYLNDFLADLPDDISMTTYDPDEDANGDRTDAIEEWIALRELEDTASGYAPDWHCGETLIHKDYFTEYAEELIKDTAGLPRDIPPYIVIDWEATAENLKADYREIEFKGQTFYIR